MLLSISIFQRGVTVIGISYTLDSASVYQKVKPKISAVSPHNNRLTIMGGKNIFLSGTVDLKPENFLPALLFFRSNVC